MRVLLLNQTFHPDVVATAQVLSDFAAGLVERGHQVTAIASRRAYDNPAQRFPSRETWRGVDIRRLPATAFGKGALWRRAADFGCFSAAISLRSRGGKPGCAANSLHAASALPRHSAAASDWRRLAWTSE